MSLCPIILERISKYDQAGLEPVKAHSFLVAWRKFRYVRGLPTYARIQSCTIRRERFVRFTITTDMPVLVFRILTQWFWTRLLSILRWLLWKPTSGDALDSHPLQVRIVESPAILNLTTLSSLTQATQRLPLKPASDDSNGAPLQVCAIPSDV
jgi:hypothetical protein